MKFRVNLEITAEIEAESEDEAIRKVSENGLPWDGCSILHIWAQQLDDELVKLSDELAAYQKQHGLPQQCAEEQQALEGIAPEHVAWLKDFCRRWDAAYTKF